MDIFTIVIIVATTFILTAIVSVFSYIAGKRSNRKAFRAEIEELHEKIDRCRENSVVTKAISKFEEHGDECGQEKIH